MHFSFRSAIDAFEDDGDRLSVRFSDKVGLFWVDAGHDELVTTLRRAHRSGAQVEITHEREGGKITDVKAS